ncbi:MAG: hypothetical protein L0I62_02845 [Gammaproteobacteria bacterium]|nr:hypothetical protein [Gammaproteobacteria bacterium]
MKGFATFCAAVLIAAISVPALATGANAEVSRSFEKTVPAAGVTRLKLDNVVGDVHVTATDTNAIKVKVKVKPGNHAHFIFDWVQGDQPANELPKDLHLITNTADGTLTLCLASMQRETGDCAIEAANAASSARKSADVVITPMGTFKTDGSNQGWKANWTIVVPARLSVVLKLGVGDLEIRGIAGGLSVKIGVGDIDARLPRGPVTAEIGVGDIDAAIAASDYGNVQLTAGVGDITFQVEGQEVRRGYEHHFTASQQSLTGSGTTDYKVEAGVGDIDLKLGVPGLTFPAIPASVPSMTTTPAATSRVQSPTPAAAPPTTSAPAPSTGHAR